MDFEKAYDSIKWKSLYNILIKCGVRRDTYRIFKEKKRDNMKANVNKLEENSKNQNIREML